MFYFISGEFSYVTGRIHLARRLGYFLINKYIPCILIICMSFVTFWIPSEAYPARVTLSVTSLLTIVTQQYQSSMPSVSYVVALNIWMLSCIGFVFCSLLEYAFVIAVMNNKGTKMWPFRKLKVNIREIYWYINSYQYFQGSFMVFNWMQDMQGKGRTKIRNHLSSIFWERAFLFRKVCPNMTRI